MTINNPSSTSANPLINTDGQAGKAQHAPGPVLFIDDVGAQTIIGIPLRRNGFNILKAHTLQEAYEVLNRYTVGIVLLGTLSPEALEFVELLRLGDHGHLPVMVLPKEGDDALLAYFQQAGVDDYVYKPIHHDQLSERIYGLLGR